nr:FHA domain-containing protein [Mycobacterium intracellulare]
MSAPAPPALTVHHEGSERTFAAGHDVVVGRDLRADMRITHPLISRAHLLLRFDQGKWLAIDNGSLNGTFVNGRRVPVVEIHDGQTLNIGNPDGPLLTFDVGRHQGMAGRPPKTESMNIPVAAPPQPAAWSAQPARPSPLHRAAAASSRAHAQLGGAAAAAAARSPAGPAGQTMYGAGGGRPPAYPPAAPPRRTIPPCKHPSTAPRRRSTSPRPPGPHPPTPSRPRWRTWRPRCSRRCGRRGPARSRNRPGRKPSGGPPTTTSSSRTCSPRAITRS